MAQKNYEQSHYEIDTLLLELGSALIPLVEEEKGAELIERIKEIRRQIAEELGLEVPKIRIRDNMLLKSSEYCIKLKGVEAGRGILSMGHYLCINSRTATIKIRGIKTIDPTFGIPALWIEQKKKDKAKNAGYTVVDHPSIIATHLTEIIKRNAADMLGLPDTQNIMDRPREKCPTVLDPDTAAYQWTLAAEQGDTEAMLRLGIYFSMKIEGRYIKTENRKKPLLKADIAGNLYMAEYWFTKAAEHGVVKAQCLLGAYYHISEHGPKDFTKAVYWYNKAASQGDCEAQLLLGNCYYEGEGVQKDPGKAAYWWYMAAAQGNEYAKNRLKSYKLSFALSFHE